MELSPNIKMSEMINELAEALSKAQSQFKAAKRDAKNPYFKSTYADLESVFEACREGLAANGLAVVQFPVQGGVETTLVHKSGQWMTGFLPMPCKENSPQAVGSAISYARRYALSAILGIPSTDDDAESAEGRKPTTPEPPPPQKEDQPKKEETPKKTGLKAVKGDEIYTGTFQQNKVFAAICRKEHEITDEKAISEIAMAVLKNKPLMKDLEQEIALYISCPIG